MKIRSFLRMDSGELLSAFSALTNCIEWLFYANARINDIDCFLLYFNISFLDAFFISL